MDGLDRGAPSAKRPRSVSEDMRLPEEDDSSAAPVCRASGAQPDSGVGSSSSEPPAQRASGKSGMISIKPLARDGKVARNNATDNQSVCTCVRRDGVR